MLKKKIKDFVALTLGNHLCLQTIRNFHKNNLLVVYYHRVTKQGEEVDSLDKNMCTGHKAFERQMDYLKENYHPVGETEIISVIEKRDRLPQYPVWITFDDGFKDNYVNAFPILKRLRIPATFFITTGFINQRVDPSKVAYSSRAGELSRASMSWEEIKELKSNGFDIGGHTATHKLLSTIDREECEKEIIESRQEIEARLNCRIFSFAYPHGKKVDINFDVHPQILEKCGFKLAVTTLGGTNSIDLWGNRFSLKRMGVSFEDDLKIFKFKAATACPWQN